MPPEAYTPDNLSSKSANGFENVSFWRRLGFLFTGRLPKSENALRDVIEEYIVEPESVLGDSSLSHERMLLSNILSLQDITVVDLMIPRADIIAVDINIGHEELMALLAEKQYSRMPVYKGTLDEVLGTVHVKDIAAMLAQNKVPDLKTMVTDLPIVSPALPALDLVLKMRQSRRHMAMVVDEYGGIDGLVTLGDVIESIVGVIEDEHDTESDPEIVLAGDGTLVADARVSLEEFEAKYGRVLSEQEREESDTLGGLVFDLAGRVPVRGEVISHDSGMVFEILEADPRRISKIRISQPTLNDDDAALSLSRVSA